MSKQYFYSYQTYIDGVKKSFGSGSITVPDDDGTAYEQAKEHVQETHGTDAQIHYIAFNRID